MEHQHPFRSLELHTFERKDHNGSGPRWLAKFYPYTKFLVFFHGDTEADAVAEAEAFRADAIAKHEANYQSRMAAIEKARAARKKKEAL